MRRFLEQPFESSIIELRELTKIYREVDCERTVLNDVNCTIRAGELIILLGKSGSGKSTLLNLISGIDLPTSGEVILRNQSLNRLPEQQRTLFRRAHIGFIFQFFNLIPTLTVEENLLLPLELNGQNGRLARERVIAMLEDVGLPARAKSYPDRLSGGEQQRVAIARALIHDPDIILADEPTGNLDYETGAQVIALLDKLVRRQQKTLIMATHSRELIGMADRIFSIREGKLVESPSLSFA
ncbi:MAG: ABC transporter ATP-binding protein [candidate division KSB1 bacterium]|nr:ABC transporter ATP-binding protein [candidate division KSB1 bacterium]MDZ7333710.1 ABC transporter ATP-binding protein [candidate division KSB1 bacterium]MDZ7356158.1 ABC transporter ATP-binding protein [candidate division KSB1 bacterium]MDZ7398864.1 ABC transporter ATP-binding protein [candidate division KSB1 bacterium]